METISIQGKPAEFVLNQSGKLTLLRARSLAHPGCSYLYEKKDRQNKQIRYQCRNCVELRNGSYGPLEKASRNLGIKVSVLGLVADSDPNKLSYSKEADGNHHYLCNPTPDVNVGALELMFGAIRNAMLQRHSKLRANAPPPKQRKAVYVRVNRVLGEHFERFQALVDTQDENIWKPAVLSYLDSVKNLMLKAYKSK